MTLPAIETQHRCTFRVCGPKSSGTCFAYEHNGEMVLLTADHVAADQVNDLTLDAPDGPKLRVIARAPEVDLAVLAAPTAYSPPCTPLLWDPQVHLAQQLWALGFPSVDGAGLGTSVILENVLEGSGSPMPLCRSGILAGGAPNTLIVDGSINRGMSGGPVVSEEGVVGVISGYYTEKLAEKLVDDHRANCGLFLATSLSALTLLEQNGG